MAENENIKKKALPIMIIGQPVLRKQCKDVEEQNEEIDLLLQNLWNTMEVSGGIGLAAPQINGTKKAFVVDSALMYQNMSLKQRKELFSGDTGIRETFINASIVKESDEIWNDREACLSIPGINEQVSRYWGIIVEYQDASFTWQKKQFSGYTAKVIQHELDHTNGILFIDHLSALKKKLLKSKLKHIRMGKVKANYLVSFPKK